MFLGRRTRPFLRGNSALLAASLTLARVSVATRAFTIRRVSLHQHEPRGGGRLVRPAERSSAVDSQLTTRDSQLELTDSPHSPKSPHPQPANAQSQNLPHPTPKIPSPLPTHRAFQIAPSASASGTPARVALPAASCSCPCAERPE